MIERMQYVWRMADLLKAGVERARGQRVRVQWYKHDLKSVVLCARRAHDLQAAKPASEYCAFTRTQSRVWWFQSRGQPVRSALYAMDRWRRLAHANLRSHFG